MGGALRFLFVPVSGPGGAGEYYRSLAIARGIERRWPDCDIKFVVSRDAAYAAGSPYPVLTVGRSPTYETAEVVRIIEQERPHVVIFDSSGRVTQYRAARRVGARVVLVSSRPSSRRRGFRFRRLWLLAQHWIAQPRYLGGQLGWWERCKLRLGPHPEVVFLEVLHEPIEEAATHEMQRRLGIEPGQYVLACPGGGGTAGSGPDASAEFLAAAGRVAGQTGLPVVAVLGARFGVPDRPPAGVSVVASVPNGLLMGLVRDARAGIVNGGSLLLQALAQRTPCVAVPVMGDQPQRIAATVTLGFARRADLDATAIAAAAIDLLRNDAEREAMRARLASLGLRNGVDVAVEATSRLVPRPPQDGPGPRRLRLMHVILSRGFAGSERAAAEACNAMVRSHDVAIVLRRDHRTASGASIRDSLDPRVEVFELPPHLGTRGRLREVIRRWRPDLVHTHLRRGTRYVAQLRSGVPHMCTLHLSLNGPHFLQAQGIVCISEWQLATVPAGYAGRVFLIPNSLVPQPRIGPERRAALRAEFGAGPGDFLVGGAGRLVRSKGFGIMIEAFRRANLPRARLVIIGEGYARGALERAARGAASFAGFRADVKDCLQALDLFVAPSLREPFGRVIIEALDAGVPVIAADANGPRDIARRFPVELVQSGDPQALAAALVRAAQQPQRPPQVDLSEFHVERVVEQLLRAYGELLGAQVRAS